METVNIKGKEYATVAERIKEFRTKFKGYRLESKLLKLGEGMVIFKATIKDCEDNVVAEGHAMEKENSSFINKTSYVENCESSAWGRALANFGIQVENSIGSAEEVSNAIKNQQ